jgi:hypothetical protein
MDEAVDGCHSCHRILEDPIPLGEHDVGRHYMELTPQLTVGLIFGMVDIHYSFSQRSLFVCSIGRFLSLRRSTKPALERDSAAHRRSSDGVRWHDKIGPFP